MAQSNQTGPRKGSKYHRFDDIPTNTFTPQTYQIQLLDVALKRNTILCLGCSESKLFLALMLAKELSSITRQSLSNGGKRIFYLTDSESDLDMLFQTLPHHTDLEINRCSPHVGEISMENALGMEEQKLNEWRLLVENSNILLCRGSLFLSLLQKNLISLSEVNLLIFDDCHKSVEGKDHPYVEIVKKVVAMPEGGQPHILGVTSSIAGTECSDPVQLNRTISDMESALHAYAETSMLILSERFGCRPSESVIKCVDYGIDADQLALREMLEDILEQNYYFFTECCIAIDEKVDKRDPKETPIQVLSQCLNILNVLGSWCTASVSEYFIMQLEKIVKFEKNTIHKTFLRCVITTLRRLIKVFDMNYHPDYDVDELLEYTTPKVRELVQVLRNYKPEVDFIIVNNEDSFNDDDFSDVSDDDSITLGSDEEDNNSEDFSNSNSKPLHIAVKRTADGGHERILTYTEEEDKNLCGIIFVENRYIAFGLNKVIEEVCSWDENLCFVKSCHVTGQGLRGSNGKNKGNKTYKRQEEALRKFRTQECNLVIATLELEEGIDIPKCNLVIRFDPPKDFRAYTLSKGRARARDASYVILLDDEDFEGFSSSLKVFKGIEQVLLGEHRSFESAVVMCSDDVVDDDHRLKDGEVVSPDVIPPYCTMPNSPNSPHVTLQGAIALINRYCAKLPSDAFTHLTPQCRVEKLPLDPPRYVAYLRLPINSPIKQELKGPEMQSSNLAMMAVALKMCEILHKTGELDENLVPVGKEMFLYEEEEEWMNEEDLAGLARPGTTKRKQYYIKKVANGLLQSCPKPESGCYLYLINLKLTGPITDEQNTRGRVIYAPEDTVQTLGLLLSKPLPLIPQFPVYTRSGEVTVSVDLLQNNLSFSSDEISRLLKFHHFVFSDVLHLDKDPMEFNPEKAECGYIIVPLNGTCHDDLNIEWNFVDKVIEFIKVEKRAGCNKKQSESLFQFSVTNFEDAVVMPSYRNIDQPQHFYVAEIRHDLNPLSPFPSPELYKTFQVGLYFSFQDYYTTKYGLLITNTEQPLLDVDHTSARLNLLTPRYMNQKGVALPTSSAETKRARRENLQQKQILIPELCDVHVFPASLWRKTVCLPTILYRTNYLLLAEELRSKISRETNIGLDQLPEGFRFAKLDFGFETSPEKLLDMELAKNSNSNNSTVPEDCYDMEVAKNSNNSSVQEASDCCDTEVAKNFKNSSVPEDSDCCDMELAKNSNSNNSTVPEDCYDMEVAKNSNNSSVQEASDCCDIELAKNSNSNNSTVPEDCYDMEVAKNSNSNNSTVPEASDCCDMELAKNSKNSSVPEDSDCCDMEVAKNSINISVPEDSDCCDMEVAKNSKNSSVPEASDCCDMEVAKNSNSNNSTVLEVSDCCETSMEIVNPSLKMKPVIDGKLDNVQNIIEIGLKKGKDLEIQTSGTTCSIVDEKSFPSLKLSPVNIPTPCKESSECVDGDAGKVLPGMDTKSADENQLLCLLNGDTGRKIDERSLPVTDICSGNSNGLHTDEERQPDSLNGLYADVERQQGSKETTSFSVINTSPTLSSGKEANSNNIKNEEANPLSSQLHTGEDNSVPSNIPPSPYQALPQSQTHFILNSTAITKDSTKPTSDVVKNCCNHAGCDPNTILSNSKPALSKANSRIAQNLDQLDTEFIRKLSGESCSLSQNSTPNDLNSSTHQDEAAIIMNTLSEELGQLDIDLIIPDMFHSNEHVNGENCKSQSRPMFPQESWPVGNNEARQEDTKPPDVFFEDFCKEDKDIIKFSFKMEENGTTAEESQWDSNVQEHSEKSTLDINSAPAVSSLNSTHSSEKVQQTNNKTHSQKNSENSCIKQNCENSKQQNCENNKLHICETSRQQNCEDNCIQNCQENSENNSISKIIENNCIQQNCEEKCIQNLPKVDESSVNNDNDLSDKSQPQALPQPFSPVTLDEDRDLHTFMGPSPCLIMQAITMSNANDFFSLERLETIGDSFLKYAITVYLYCSYPGIHEGKLSYLRSKQVSNYNLYRLGRRKGLAECMVSTKFEPYENWLPPGFVINDERRRGPVPKVVIVTPELKVPSSSRNFYLDESSDTGKRDEALMFNKELEWIQQSQEADQQEEVQAPTHSLTPYSLQCHHGLPDKSVADCVEALIGCYLTTCGRKAALIFMSWLGLRVLPKSKRRKEISFSNDGRKNGKLLEQEFDELRCPPSPMFSNTEANQAKLQHLLEGFDSLEEKICYKFRDKSYLLQAFTHASYHYNTITDCYQRVEFLGDAILDYVITRHLYEDSQKYSPGILTDLRSALVNNNIFAALAVKWGFHKYFKAISPSLFYVIDKFVKRQKEKREDDIDIDEEFRELTFEEAEPEENAEEDDDEEEVEMEIPKALGDIFESVAGAIYLDSGMSLDTVWRVYYRMMKPHIDKYLKSIPKSPVRELLETEPETAKFERPERTMNGKVRVTVNVVGKGVFTGVGRNYRIAKSAAAKKALKSIRVLSQNLIAD
ncbi:endoribonuclease Dicer-like isoform X2 [Physella acuta]|uniref:endoribonuclease Dicer-like isoform X2 n=1 Tax=Physella acuta TaxID=109671 RepID=UPI0027DC7F54|nr:endoribonuclease Dicer-like isoform X2 [Physella acuta]